MIRREDLPEVSIGDGCYGSETVAIDYGTYGHAAPMPHCYTADELIALGLYLREHAPVDSEAVRAVRQAHEDIGIYLDGDQARRLVERGVRVEVTR